MNRRSFLATAAAGLGAPPASGEDLAWPAVKPGDAGFDAAKLEAARDNLEKRNTHALLVLKDGHTALEWYSAGKNAATRHNTASMAKALVGGTSLLLALNDGRLKLGDRAARYIPQWRDHPLKSKITLLQLATHTSGIQDSSVPGVVHPNEPGWQGLFWRRDPEDPFTIALRDAPVLFEPGTGYEYSNPGMAALAYAVTASLRGAPQTEIRTLLRERVLRPIGIPDDHWSIGYGRAYRVDGLDLYANWGGGEFTARAAARMAEWMMRSGQWGGKALIAERWPKQAVQYTGVPLPNRREEPFAPGLGVCWYTNFDMVWPTVPRDAFLGSGAGHRMALVVPSLQLIVVRNGLDLRANPDEEGYSTALYRHVFEPVMAALGYPAKTAAVPYPQSAVISGVEFAPAESIVRKAVESDNWPLTWADDDAIYTSYGDGWGFEPLITDKLSMGFAKVEGNAAEFRGVNIRSASGERKGDGKDGAKSSGMLMVDGVLYMWIRNVNNAQIASSVDHARTWKWGFRLDRSFGCPAFLNFGKNYEGARDEYIYTYSQDGPSAYAVDDGIVLARAPKHRLMEREAWEFYDGAQPNEPAHWTREVDARRRVFQFAGHCQRVDAVYHPVLKRYLLAVGYGHTGGWGLYEAPEPWGPWSVAFHTEYWGVGQTHGYRLPAKWISQDGRTMALVFSGLRYNGVVNDAFCLRKMTLQF